MNHGQAQGSRRYRGGRWRPCWCWPARRVPARRGGEHSPADGSRTDDGADGQRWIVIEPANPQVVWQRAAGPAKSSTNAARVDHGRRPGTTTTMPRWRGAVIRVRRRHRDRRVPSTTTTTTGPYGWHGLAAGPGAAGRSPPPTSSTVTHPGRSSRPRSPGSLLRELRGELGDRRPAVVAGLPAPSALARCGPLEPSTRPNLLLPIACGRASAWVPSGPLRAGAPEVELGPREHAAGRRPGDDSPWPGLVGASRREHRHHMDGEDRCGEWVDGRQRLTLPGTWSGDMQP